MGCGSSIRKMPSFQEYILLKEEVFATEEFKFLQTFYKQLWPTAYKVIKLSKNYDGIFTKIDGLTEAIQEFGQFDILKPITNVLSIIPQFFKPMVEKARFPIFSALPSALQFAKQCWDFKEDLTQLFKLLKKLEKGKVLDRKARFEHACNIMKCLKEKITDHIKVIEVDKNLGELRSIVNKISKLDTIAGPVNKLKKFLCTKLFGISVMSLLGGQTSGMKGVIIKATLKGLSLGIKKAVSAFKKDSQEYAIPEFPKDIQIPQSGWLGLHYAYDYKVKKLDLVSSLPKQWVIDNLGDEHQWLDLMKDYEKPPKNKKKKKTKKSDKKDGEGQEEGQGQGQNRQDNNSDEDEDDDDDNEEKDSIFKYTPDQAHIEEMRNKGKECIDKPNPTSVTIIASPNPANDLPNPLPSPLPESVQHQFPQLEKVIESVRNQEGNLEDLEVRQDEENIEKNSTEMDSDMNKEPLPAVV